MYDLSMQSLNIRFVGKDEIEVLEEEVGTPGPDQILVRAQKSLISTGTESICLGRKFAPTSSWNDWVKYPFYPGYLCMGVVAQVGENVSNVQVGERIACRGAHRQFFLMDGKPALRVPDAVADEDAAWYGLATITQNGVRKAQHVMGDCVVVIGLGLLGQLVVQYARLMGAREVVAIDIAPRRLEIAKAHGATLTLQMGAEDAKPHLEALTNGRLADVVYDVTGHAPVFAHALGLLRKQGTLILLGDSGTPSEQRLTSDLIGRGLRIIGAHDVETPLVSDTEFWTRGQQGSVFFNYLERGQMRVNDLVTHRFSPRDAVQAYKQLETDRASIMGVVFDWTLV